MENVKISRKVLANSFNDKDVLAYFYDSRNEIILKLKACKTVSKTDQIKSEVEVDIRNKVTNSKRDVLDFLNIEPELKLSILAGLVKTDVSERFLFDFSSLEENVCIIQIEIVTSEISADKFEISDKKKIIEHITSNKIDERPTHKIDSLKFGHKWIVAIKYKDEDSYLESQLEKSAESIVKDIKEGNEIKEIENTYDIVFYDNYLNKSKIKSFKKIQSIIKDIKEKKKYDKTHLLEIQLMDINKFCKDYEIPIDKIQLTTGSNEEKEFYDSNRITILELNQLNNINNYTEYLTDKENSQGDKIKSLKDNFEKNFKNDVIQMRNGKKKEFKAAMRKLDEEILSFHMNNVFERINDIDSFKDWKISFLKKNKHLKQKKEILYWGYSQKLKSECKEEWDGLRGTVITSLIEKYFKQAVVIDYDLHKEVDLPKFCSKDGNFKMCLFRWEKNDYTLFKIKVKSNKNVIKDDFRNILLLGETGVGKSTYINAIFNYFLFDSLDEAENAEKVSCPLYAKFSYYDDDYKLIDIKMGDESDENEVFLEGQSSTQSARAYILKEKKIRIIDTPGMGDTRGINVDSDNFRKTIDFISNFHYLDCICFLVKPNSARLGQVFKYCFKELFSNLSKTSVKNIVFCFTNTRGTMYRPGETINPLKYLINDINSLFKAEIPIEYENIFCMDNEAFRYLMLIKSNIKLDASERTNYMQSWERSVSESQRMLDYIKTLKRMVTNDIVVLNKFKFGYMDWTSELIKLLTEIERKVILRETKIEELGSFNKKPDLNKTKNKLEKEIDKLLEIRNTIINDCAKLYSYISEHSIAIFNDYFEAHIDETIQQEKLKEYATKNESTLLTKLKILKDNYISERKKAKTPTEEQYEEIRNNITKYSFKDLDDLVKDE